MTSPAIGPINLNLSSAVGVLMSTAVNGTGPLTGGVYDVWAVTQNAYINVAQSVSSANTLSSSSAYPVIGAAAPKSVVVPPNFMIGFASSSSGVFAYQRIG
jgi:hypothetical protein